MIYILENSWNGLLNCIFEVMSRNDHDILLEFEGNVNGSLFQEGIIVEIHPDRSKRVLKGLKNFYNPKELNLLLFATLSESINAFRSVFNVMHKCFTNNEKVALDDYGNYDVLFIAQTAKSVSRERHRMKAFIRFKQSNDGLYFATVEPDFNVLPLIASFFKNRYTDQKWLIYDVKRNYGIYYDLTQVTEVNLSKEEIKENQQGISTQSLQEDEILYQNLWKDYFKSTNIEARKNDKLHIQLVPKRYWKYLIEKQLD